MPALRTAWRASGAGLLSEQLAELRIVIHDPEFAISASFGLTSLISYVYLI